MQVELQKYQVRIVHQGQGQGHRSKTCLCTLFAGGLNGSICFIIYFYLHTSYALSAGLRYYVLEEVAETFFLPSG